MGIARRSKKPRGFFSSSVRLNDLSWGHNFQAAKNSRSSFFIFYLFHFFFLPSHEAMLCIERVFCSRRSVVSSPLPYINDLLADRKSFRTELRQIGRSVGPSELDSRSFVRSLAASTDFGSVRFFGHQARISITAEKKSEKEKELQRSEKKHLEHLAASNLVKTVSSLVRSEVIFVRSLYGLLTPSRKIFPSTLKEQEEIEQLKAFFFLSHFLSFSFHFLERARMRLLPSKVSSFSV